MDITEPSKSSTAATRKRRSSILKSQRRPRTPFSDLEFNVATPTTDTTTSRRVSFSRRTGVAEFITNEATTTWKNVYEEQNKSLETSNNENEVKRQPLGHIGRRNFDDHFQEVNYAEHLASIDCINNDGDLIAPQQNFEFSCFTEHHNNMFGDNIVNPDVVEMTDHIDINFSVDQPNNASMEMDNLDEIEKVILQPRSSAAMVVGPSKDGFIELDLNTTQNTFAIEQSDMSITDTIHSAVVEASSNNASLKIDKSFNIKDWVADKENIVVNPYATPPEVENFAINNDNDQVLVFDGKRLTIQSRSTDLLGDREKSSRKSVASGKKKRIKLVVTDDLPDFTDNTKLPYITSEIMNNSANTKKMEKTMLYDNGNDISITQAVGCVIETQTNKNKTIMYCNDDIDISLTIAAPNNIILNSENVISNKSKTVIYESDLADISMTQALPAKVIEKKEESLFCNNNELSRTAISSNNKTVVFETDDCDISVTQAAISSNMLLKKSKTNSTITYVEKKEESLICDNDKSLRQTTLSNKSKTMVFDNDDCDLSVTQAAISSNILLEKSKNNITIGHQESFGDSLICDNKKSLRQNTLSNKSKTMVFENDDCDISVTQAAISSNILLEKFKNNITIGHHEKYQDSLICDYNKSSKQNTSSNKSKTMVFENDDCDISVTQAAISSNILLEKSKNNITIGRQEQYGDSLICDNKSLRQNASSNNCNTFVFENDNCDISAPQAVISSNILIEKSNKNKTIVYQIDSGNISLTQARPSNLIVSDKRNAIGNRQSDISLTLSNNAEKDEKRTILYQDNVENFSLTQALPSKLIISDNIHNKSSTVISNRQSDISIAQKAAPNLIVSCDDEGHMSMTQALPINLLESQNEGLNISEIEKNPNEQLIMLHKSMQDKTSSLSFTQMLRNNILESKSEDITSEKRKTIVFDNDMGDVSLTQAVSGNALVEAFQQKTKFNALLSQNMDIPITENMSNIINETKENKTIIIPDKSIDYDISITQAVPHSNIGKNMAKNVTIAYENDAQNMSITKPIPNAFLNVDDNEFKVKEDKYNEIFLQNQCPMNNNMIVYQTTTAIDADTPTEDSSSHNVKSDITNKLDLNSQNIQNVLEKSSCILQPDRILNRQSVAPDSPMNNSLTLDLPDPSAIQPKNSILNDLLDMSNASLVDGIKNKNMAAVKLENSEKEISIHSDTSNNSIFYIIKDCDEVAEIKDNIVTAPVKVPMKIKQNSRKSIHFVNDDETQGNSSLPAAALRYEGEKQSNVVKSLEKKFNKIKHFLISDKKIKSIENKQDLYAETKNDDVVENKRGSQQNSSLQIENCDNTADLLDVLSYLSDTRRAPSPIENIKEDLPIDNSRLMGFDNKSKSCEPLNLPSLANRQSIILSGEELINNLSMAQAVLQKSQMDIDENISFDDTANTVTTKTNKAPKKTVRLSSDVVKTLQFEDESVSEMSVKSLNKYISPIRKTVFGETSYMNEGKGKVIPSYMEDVATNLKALMTDLVKPMADVCPYKAFTECKDPCKCDNQVQADLITSSQIDLERVLQTTPSDEFSKADISATNDIAGKSSTFTILRNKFGDKNNAMELDVDNDLNANKQEVKSDNVLCFDPHNPLNNVLLAPIDACEVHKYNPMHSTESILSEHSELSNSSLCKSNLQNQECDAEIGLVSTYFNQNDKFSVSFNASDSETIGDRKNISKLSMSVDRAVDVRETELKHTDCNTVIAMKPNKELLDASSSLTLVDDAINQNPDEDVVMCEENTPFLEIMETDDEIDKTKVAEKKVIKIKPKKRIYSPSIKKDVKQSNISVNIDVTPKPASKIFRRSGSLDINETEYCNDSQQAVHVKPGPIPEMMLPLEDVMKKPLTKEKMSSKKIDKQNTKDKKPVTSVTVQHLMTEFQMNDKIDENKLNKSILKVLTNEISKTDIESEEVLIMKDNLMLDSVNSFTSSNNQMRVLSSQDRSETVIASSICSETSKSTYSELSNSVWGKESRSEAPSSQFYAECEPSVNIVAKINMLPFMGDAAECEWECSIGDTWSFRLLHERVRLVVRLAHSHRNAPRTSVRADTPLSHVAVELIPRDIKNPVGIVCVPYAVEAMRAHVAEVRVAAQVPALLRRCAAVARLATRWARAMHDARYHLAYKLAPDHLVLKVANIPLRCVWEVTMDIELAWSEELRERFPRVTAVRARSVLEHRDSPPERELSDIVQRVPLDWGHVPRTLWRIFKHLKHKKREDDIFGLI